MTVVVETGTKVLAAGDASDTVAITTVVMANAFVTMSYSIDDASPGFSSLTCQLASTTTIRFDRVTAASSPAITITWQVVSGTEFTVERGATDVATDPTDVTITAIDGATCWCISYTRRAGATLGSDDWCSTLIEPTTNLRIGCVGATSGVTCEWQVITYSGCAVVRGQVALGTGTATGTGTVTAVDLAKTLLLISFESDSGTSTDVGQKMVRAEMSSTTEVLVTRINTGQAMTVEWELIEFTDATTVYPIVVNHSTTETDVDDTVPAVTLARTWPVAAGYKYCGGTTGYSTADNPHVAQGSLTLDSTTNLNTVKALHGSAASIIQAYVVEFPAAAGAGRIMGAIAGLGGLAGHGGIAGPGGGIAGD